MNEHVSFYGIGTVPNPIGANGSSSGLKQEPRAAMMIREIEDAVSALAHRLEGISVRTGATRAIAAMPGQPGPVSEPVDHLGHLEDINRRLHALVQTADLVSEVV